MKNPTNTKTLLRSYRKRHKLSQSDLARELNISVRTLQNWEIGRNEPKGYGKIALLERIKK